MAKQLKFAAFALVAALSSAGLAQTANATDRFDVIIEVVSFKSLVDMDPSNATDEYYMTVHADIAGAGRRSIYNLNRNGAPMRTLRIGRRVRFSNIKEPSRSNRSIRIFSDVSEKDVIKKKDSIFDKPRTEVRYADMGAARRNTSRDLFREADRSRSNVARETVLLSTRKYRMEVRVTVIEVD